MSIINAGGEDVKLEDIDKFARVQSQLEQLHKEMSVLAKSKQDNPINRFKLNVINEKLGEANSILIGTFKPLADFDTFGDDDLPTNSDVVMVLSQYLDSLEAWRSANVLYSPSDYEWYWNTGGKLQVKSTKPTRFRQIPSGDINTSRGQTE